MLHQESCKGSLVCDDLGGYKAGFANGVTEVGCLAHARRKFLDLHVSNKSQIVKQAVRLIGSFAYHFWMQDMNPLRRRNGDQYLHRESQDYRDAVKRKTPALKWTPEMRQ